MSEDTETPKPADVAGRLDGLVGRWIRKIFCVHTFLGVSQDKYNVVRDDGAKEGEVTILHLRCRYCGYEKAIPVDRTHLTPNKD